MVNKKKTISLNEKSIILISGGGKGITAQCAIKLAEVAQCRFILIGRSARLESEPEWAQDIQNSEELKQSALDFFKGLGKKITPRKLQKEIKQILSNREISSTLHEIETCGGSAIYISADVTNKKTLSSKVKSAVKELGPVTGIIHGAGNLADKLIENKSAADFDLVVNTKVMGLKNIIGAVTPESLDFLVLFSSVAGFFGNAGQADYAIANEILNKSAYIIQESLPKCRVISINWGPWESGMVSPELKKIFKKRNIQLISTEYGVETLVNELTSTEHTATQIVVGNPINAHFEINAPNDDAIFVHRHLKHSNNPFLNDHCIGSQAVLPATCASAWLADTCLALNPGYTFAQMEDFKILKGLTFNDNGHLCEVELKPLSNLEKGKKTYTVTITSHNQNNRKIFHYSGQVSLVRDIPEPPIFSPVNKLTLNDSMRKAGNELYANGTLFHGPSFQGIQELLLLDDKTVITRVSIPEMNIEDQGQFPVRATNPYINDAVVQSLLIWTQEYYDAPCLPSRLHKWNQYRVVPFGQSVWVILNVTYHNENAVIGDLFVQDEAGVGYYDFTGLEGTVSKHLKKFIGKKN